MATRRGVDPGTLHEFLLCRFDDDIGDVSSGRQRSDGYDQIAEVFWLQDRCLVFVADRIRALFENRCVYFTWKDVRDANAVCSFFVAHCRPQRSHREFRGTVRDPAQGSRPET